MEFRDLKRSLRPRETVEDDEDNDLPHRTKLIQLIFDTYAKEHATIVDDLKVSCYLEYLISSLLSKLSGKYHSHQTARVTPIWSRKCPSRSISAL